MMRGIKRFIRRVLNRVLGKNSTTAVVGIETNESSNDGYCSNSTASLTESSTLLAAILELPVELIRSIADFLPRADVVALSLSCKDLFTVLPHLHIDPVAGSAWKVSLLRRLERDLGTTHSLCPMCLILHRFDKDVQKQFDRERARGGRCGRSAFTPVESWTGGACRLGYQTVRLLRNHQRRPGHGLSLDEVFAATRTSMPEATDAENDRWHVAVDGKFVDGGDLIVRATHTIRGDAKDIWRLFRTIKSPYHMLCRHYAVFDDSDDYFWGHIAIHGRAHTVGEKPSFSKGCHRCISNWYYELIKGEEDSFTIRVVAHHLVGDGRSHEDDAWRFLTNREDVMAPELQREMVRNHPRGSLIMRWNAAS